MTKMYACIFFEKEYLLDDEAFDFIMEYDNNKDIYFENPDQENIEFTNYCLIC